MADLDQDVEIRPELVKSMRHQGRLLAPEAVPALYETFGSWELVEAEEKLYENIKTHVYLLFDFSSLFWKHYWYTVPNRIS